MKKKLCLFVVALLSLFTTVNVNAAVESTNLKETVEDEINTFSAYVDQYEEIATIVNSLQSVDLDDYEPNSSKVQVYIFRGSTCSHCLEAVDFFARLYEEHGDKFDLVAYETWNNTDNATLMTNVGSKLNVEVSGVPFIVIGDQYFSGYASSMDEEILDAINDEYKASTKTDIVKQILGGDTGSSSNVITYVILIVAAVIVIAIIVSRKNVTYVEDTESSDEDVDESEDEEVEEEVEEKPKKEATKSTTKKTNSKATTKKVSTTKKVPAKSSSAKKTSTKSSTKKTTAKKNSK